VSLVVNEGIQIAGSFLIPEHELGWKFGPSGGPGGQHANRAHTRVELRWVIANSSGPSDRQRSLLTGTLGDPVLVVVDDERSQVRNRDIARERLARRVGEALHEPRDRRPTRPTLGSKRRRVDDKHRGGCAQLVTTSEKQGYWAATDGLAEPTGLTETASPSSSGWAKGLSNSTHLSVQRCTDLT